MLCSIVLSWRTASVRVRLPPCPCQPARGLGAMPVPCHRPSKPSLSAPRLAAGALEIVFCVALANTLRGGAMAPRHPGSAGYISPVQVFDSPPNRSPLPPPPASGSRDAEIAAALERSDRGLPPAAADGALLAPRGGTGTTPHPPQPASRLGAKTDDTDATTSKLATITVHGFGAARSELLAAKEAARSANCNINAIFL